MSWTRLLDLANNTYLTLLAEIYIHAYFTVTAFIQDGQKINVRHDICSYVDGPLPLMSKFSLQFELLPHCSNLSSLSRQKWAKLCPEQMSAERFIAYLGWSKDEIYTYVLVYLIILQLLFTIIRLLQTVVCCVCQADRAPRSMREMQGNKTAACVTQPCYGSHFFKLMSSSFLLPCSKKLLNHKRQST